MLDLIWIILIAPWSAPREVRDAGSDPGGFFVTALLGWRSARGHLPGAIYRALRPGQGAGFLASIVGAILVLIIYRSVRKRQG